MAEDLIPFNPIGSGKSMLGQSFAHHLQAYLLRRWLADLEDIQRLSRETNTFYARAMVEQEVFVRQLDRQLDLLLDAGDGESRER